MIRSAKKHGNKCNQHSDCFFSQTLTVSFCSSAGKKKTKKQQFGVGCLNCPLFNNDGDGATQTFILTSEKSNYESKRERNQQEKKIIEYNDKTNQILLPKPRSKHKHCHVCSKQYDDYLIHIQSEQHKECIKASRFNLLIMELTKKLNYDKPSFDALNPTKNSSQDDQDVQVYSQPTKRIKLDEDGQLSEKCHRKMLKSRVVNPNFSPFVCATSPNPFNQAFFGPKNISSIPNYNFLNMVWNPYMLPYVVSPYLQQTPFQHHISICNNNYFNGPHFNNYNLFPAGLQGVSTSTMASTRASLTEICRESNQFGTNYQTEAYQTEKQKNNSSEIFRNNGLANNQLGQFYGNAFNFNLGNTCGHNPQSIQNFIRFRTEMNEPKFGYTSLPQNKNIRVAKEPEYIIIDDDQ